MKNTLKDNDFIKPGYENLYGKIYLIGMRNMKKPINVFLLFILFFTCTVYVIPNPRRVDISLTLMLINAVRSVITIVLCFIIYLRVRHIYNSSQPWKFGLEYSIHFLSTLCLLAISCMFDAIYMTEYLYKGNYFFIYLAILLIIVSVIATLIFFRKRGITERGSNMEALSKLGPIGKLQISGAIIFLVITFVKFPQKETIAYVASLLLSFIFFSLAFPMLLGDIYCLSYREGIDYDVFYEFTDGIDPNKQYPPNFGDVKKKFRKK